MIPLWRTTATAGAVPGLGATARGTFLAWLLPAVLGLPLVVVILVAAGNLAPGGRAHENLTWFTEANLPLLFAPATSWMLLIHGAMAFRALIPALLLGATGGVLVSPLTREFRELGFGHCTALVLGFVHAAGGWGATRLLRPKVFAPPPNEPDGERP